MKEQIDQKKIERQNRVKEIEIYVQEYFKKYKVGYEASGHGKTQDTNLAESFWMELDSNSRHYNKKFSEILEKKLAKKDLVDLGVGHSWRNIPYGKIPFKSYTAVDIELPSKESIEENGLIENFKKNNTKATFIESDMLKYVTHLPDKSSNFLLSAIDSDVILDKNYWKYLFEEIYRATEDHGVIIDTFNSIGSYLNEYNKDKWKRIDEEKGYMNERIYEKI